MFIILVIVLITIPSCLFAVDTPAAAEFKSIEEVLKYTAKITEDDTKRSTLKHVRKEVARVRELWDLGYVQNSLPLLLNIRTILYRNVATESLTFQQNLKSIMMRLWPFILKSGRFRSEVHTFQGITSVTLIVPEGRFVLSIPLDARPGETISGRIESGPPDLVNTYLLTIAGAPVVADNQLRKWVLPQTFELILRDIWANEVIRVRQDLAPDPTSSVDLSPASSELQIEKQPRELRPNIEIPHLRFEISSRVNAGGHLIVDGPFDGDFSTTVAGIGKYQAQILGESPRRLVLGIHPRMTGPWTILIAEGENRVRCRINIQSETVDPFATLETCTPP